ncbi:MAG: RNA polymerase subunit sigma-70 [Mycobacteriaceae bacterium]|nr:RNA polymerase subunit sigma-70 [Mycobacteriaceae bacterium]
MDGECGVKVATGAEGGGVVVHDDPAADLLSRAKAGDAGAFRLLTEPHRAELQVHCYRMLGSVEDAEDAVQDTLFSAWQALAGFDRRAALRTWLYRIATNRCLNLRRAAVRRPPKQMALPMRELPESNGLGEVVWLQPYPDSLLEQTRDLAPGPHARLEQNESISLAFVTALQLLPPRQVAVLVLRDVLGFHAKEVAHMVDSSLDSVNSVLKRARSSLRAAARPDQPPRPKSPDEQAIVAKFVSAYESADVDSLVTLLTDDAFMWMPPMPFEYKGPDAVARLIRSVFDTGRRFDLVPTRANGQPAFGSYVRTSDSKYASGLIVLGLSGSRICSLTRFDRGVFPWFGLPRTLTD